LLAYKNPTEFIDMFSVCHCTTIHMLNSISSLVVAIGHEAHGSHIVILHCTKL